MTGPAADVWAAGEAYEPYVGRWSRLVAREFLAWLGRPAGHVWLDVGCGTGALTAAVLERCAPAAVIAVDRSPGYVGYARRQLDDARLRAHVADAQALSIRDRGVDAAVSGLVLNFVADQSRMVAEMRRAVRPGGAVAARFRQLASMNGSWSSSQVSGLPVCTAV